MNPPKAIFFDLDETLLDDNRSYEESISRVCVELASAFPHFAFENLFDRYRECAEAYWLEVGERVTLGLIDGQAVRLEGWRRALFECGCDDPALSRTALAVYSRHRLETYSLFADARLLLERLSGRLPMAVITNGSATTQWEKVRQLGLDALCKAVIVSGDIGVVKPDPAIFRLALDKLGLAPDQVWHVGDSLPSDVAGAKAAGLTAVWLNRTNTQRPNDAAKPDFEIASLDELLPLLERSAHDSTSA